MLIAYCILLIVLLCWLCCVVLMYLCDLLAAGTIRETVRMLVYLYYFICVIRRNTFFDNGDGIVRITILVCLLNSTCNTYVDDIITLVVTLSSQLANIQI